MLTGCLFLRIVIPWRDSLDLFYKTKYNGCRHLKIFWPRFGNSTGSHLEVGETDSPDNTTVISHLATANSSTTLHDSTRPPSKYLGHCLKNDTGSHLEDDDTAMSSTIVGIQILRIHQFSFGHTGKCIHIHILGC